MAITVLAVPIVNVQTTGAPGMGVQPSQLSNSQPGSEKAPRVTSVIHAHQNLIPIVRPLVDLQYVFHRAHKLRALTGRDAPTLLQPRLQFVFLSAWRTVSVLMVSTISHSTNWSANSFRVQLARPSGGSPQAIAINRASPSPSSLF